MWHNKQVISVGGGKGGVGKSCFAANLGFSLAHTGKKVVLVDADLGAANLHTMVGIRYAAKTLEDFIKGSCGTVEQAILDTPYPGLRLLSSASDILSLAGPNYKERMRLLKGIDAIDCDVLIFDIAAGTHVRAIDFFSLAPVMVILTEPVPTSLENSFSFLKNLLLRQLLRVFYHDREMRSFIQHALSPGAGEQHVHFSELIEKLEKREPKKLTEYNRRFLNKLNGLFMVANRVKSQAQTQAFDMFMKIVKRYLGLQLRIVGHLPFEADMDNAIITRTPFCSKYPHNGYSLEIQRIVERLQTFRSRPQNTFS